MKNAYLILFTLFIVSCAGHLENKKNETDFLNSIVGKWSLFEMKGLSNTDIKNLRKAPFIQFEGNKINGSNGCNNFFSSIASITKNTITFSAFGETKMMCQEMKIPDNFGRLISNIDTYLVKNNTIVFLNKENEKILSFTKE
jgi:heat shock protein HslJ